MNFLSFENSNLFEPRIGNMFPRMVRYVSIKDDDNEILVIKQHAYDNTQTLEGGYVRDFDAVRFYIRAQTQSNDSKTIQTPGTTTPSQTILSQKRNSTLIRPEMHIESPMRWHFVHFVSCREPCML